MPYCLPHRPPPHCSLPNCPLPRCLVALLPTVPLPPAGDAPLSPNYPRHLSAGVPLPWCLSSQFSLHLRPTAKLFYCLTAVRLTILILQCPSDFMSQCLPDLLLGYLASTPRMLQRKDAQLSRCLSSSSLLFDCAAAPLPLSYKFSLSQCPTTSLFRCPTATIRLLLSVSVSQTPTDSLFCCLTVPLPLCPRASLSQCHIIPPPHCPSVSLTH
jgi:hypothetical protein